MNTSKVLKFSSMTIRVLIGTLFVISAIAKLLAIDNFEVYIYSFNIFRFETVTILSRLLIATEFFIGLCLVFRIFYKEIWSFSLLLLVFFTIFLVYVIKFRNDDNCHCFGDLLSLDPKQSIAKNIIMIGLMMFIRNIEDYSYSPKVRKWLVGGFVAVSIAIPFIIVPNDLIYNKLYSEKENINTIGFYESLNDSTYIGYLNVIPERADSIVVFENEERLMDVGEGRYIINYVIAGCKYCKMGANRLAIMFDRYGISHDRLKFVVGGNEVPMSLFIRLTDTYDYGHWKISQPVMMSITYGRFPLYVFVEDGKIVKASDFRHLDEGEVVRFLSANENGNR